MKIVHVCDYYEPKVGGFIVDSTKQLAARGHDITIFTSNVADVYSAPGQLPEGITVRRFGGRKFGERAIYPGLFPALLKEKCDVVHAYGLGFFSGFAAGYVRPFKTDTPLVLRADFSIYEKISAPKKLFHLFWRNVPLSTADSVTVHMKLMKDLLIKNYGTAPEKVNVLSHGINFEEFERAGTVSNTELDGKFTVLNVSRADKWKDPLKIIRALPELKKVCKDFVFVHIGPYYDKEYYAEMKGAIESLGLSGNVLLLGEMKHEDIIRFYKSADVYVQSSIEESFGLSTLEAMAAGLPVVATKTGAIGYEWFENYDYWFSTPDELGKKLAFLYANDKERRELGQRLKSIAKSYDWKTNIKNVEHIYEKSIENLSKR
jgi:1,2-diacylglycerol 3-alpha-glucosyltransferase